MTEPGAVGGACARDSRLSPCPVPPRTRAFELAAPTFIDRAVSTLRRLLAAGLILCAARAPLGAQAPLATSTAVDTLIDASGIPNVLAGLGGVVQAQLARIAPALPAEQMARAREVVARQFEGARLYESVAAALTSQAQSGQLVELYEGFTAGAVSETRRQAAAYRPPLPLDQFVAALSDVPPPQERVQVMLRLAEAQGAASLYLTLAESARGAATVAARALDPNIPSFRALPDDQVALALEQHDRQTVVLFLHRYAPLSDAQIAALAERYESPAGRWFVDALTRAVRDAVLTAAERAADELRGGSRSELRAAS
jgi:hypothetical protein